jgi:hypothetical protein
MRRVLAMCLLALGVAAAACESETPGDKYDDFLERADRHVELGDSTVAGQLVDVGNREYLMHIALVPLGDVKLRLRVFFTSYVENAAGTEAQIQGEVRFEPETLQDPPITSFESTMDANGKMIVSTGIVQVPAERSPVPNTAVEAELTFTVYALDQENLCGLIEDEQSQVLQPIQLKLKRTTFGAKLIENGVIPPDIPLACPGQGGDAGGDSGSDAPASDAPADTSTDADDSGDSSDSGAGDVSSDV